MLKKVLIKILIIYQFSVNEALYRTKLMISFLLVQSSSNNLNYSCVLQIHVTLTQQVNLRQAFHGRLVCQWPTDLKIWSLQIFCFHQIDLPATNSEIPPWSSRRMSRHLMTRQVSLAVTRRKDTWERQTISVVLIYSPMLFCKNYFLPKSCLCLESSFAYNWRWTLLYKSVWGN